MVGNGRVAVAARLRPPLRRELLHRQSASTVRRPPRPHPRPRARPRARPRGSGGDDPPVDSSSHRPGGLRLRPGAPPPPSAGGPGRRARARGTPHPPAGAGVRR